MRALKQLEAPARGVCDGVGVGVGVRRREAGRWWRGRGETRKQRRPAVTYAHRHGGSSGAVRGAAASGQGEVN